MIPHLKTFIGMVYNIKGSGKCTLLIGIGTSNLN